MPESNTLRNATPVAIVCTRNREKSKAFFADVLGLELLREDHFAAIFRTGGITLRVSSVPDFEPHAHTVLGFEVKDVANSVRELKAKGVVFNIYEGFGQDENGVWKSPDGSARVAWFKDPDGNVLSLTQF